MTAATLIAVYVPFLRRLRGAAGRAPDDGHLRVLVTLAAVVLSDTGGYVAGVFFGKHPMAPAVSPKKSWEGFAGSVAAGGGRQRAAAVAAASTSRPGGARCSALAVSVAAVLGDLAESMLKRDLGRQGHEQPAARPRRPDGPAGLDPLRRADRVPAARGPRAAA